MSDALALSAPLMLSLGSRGLAGHLTVRLFANSSARFVPIYCAILTTSVGLSVLYVGVPKWAGLTSNWCLASFLSIPFGAWCAVLDKRILHAAWTHRYRVGRVSKRLFEQAREPGGQTVVAVPLFTGGGRSTLPMKSPKQMRSANKSSNLDYYVNACVGCLEELVYRGTVLQLALAAGSVFLYWTILISSALAFCVGHANFGIYHILSKLPLSLACLGLALWQGVFPALSCHLVFNLLITSWIDRRKVTNGVP
jgi:Type II CAAX prenyl endopeptidase Rce1-like